MSRLEEIKNDYAKEMAFDSWNHLVAKIMSNSNGFTIALNTIILHNDEATKIYAKECSQASLEKAKKDLYNYWIFFEEGKTNSPEFTIKVEDPAKVYNTAYEAYGPQVQDLFYSCVSHEESITSPENIILL